MAISDKLNYLIETKSQLKDMINYGLPTENQITNETTFRNYVKGIFEAFLESLRDSTTLYTNLPKISGNGTQITLNDTANAPMRITLKATELTQAGTPTPSSPQDIHTISGSNKVVVCGKNMLNPNKFTSSTNIPNIDNTTSVIDINTNSSANFIRIFDNLNLPANNYTIYCEVISGTYTGGNLCFYDLSGTKYSSEFSFRLSTTHISTLNATNGLNKLQIYAPSCTSNVKLKIWLVKGTYTSESMPTYEPYISQEANIDLGNIEYCKIGNYEDEFIRTSGKNLFDSSTITSIINGSISNSVVTSNALSTSYDGASANINNLTLQAGTYYISINVKLNSGSTNGVNTITLYGLSSGDLTMTTKPTISSSYQSYVGKITISEAKTISRIGIQLSTGNSSAVISFTNIMISKENIDYEPYGTNQWYLKKNIGKVVLDGSENFTSAGTSGTDYRYNKTLSNLNIPNATTNNGLCISNYFQNVTIDTSKKWGAFYINGNWLVFYDKNQEMTDATTFNTWLSNNNTTIYYVLATPTYTQITGELETQLNNIYEKLLSYKGTTNISQVNNDLPFVLGVSAIQDLE